MSIESRRRLVRQHGYCRNCLARSHASDECTSADVCQKCGWAHHTLLHQRTQEDQTMQRHQQQYSRRQPPQQCRRVRHQSQQSQPRNRSPRTQRELPYNRKLNNERLSNSTTSSRRILREALRALEKLKRTL